MKKCHDSPVGSPTAPALLLFPPLVLAGLCGLASACAEKVEYRFRLLDESRGKTTTAMVCIRNLDDGTVRLPPDGRVSRRVSKTSEFYRGIAGDAKNRRWIGPVRKTMGKGDNDDRSYVYEERPSIPYWREPVMFQTQGTFTITLSPGRYRIAVSHGMEYVPVFREFTVRAKQPQETTIELKRWVHLAKRGWYSGDVHVHHPTLKPAHREFLLRYAEAEDLNVVNVLEMGHHRGTEFKQEGFGKKFRTQRGDYCLVSGQEEPRSTFGHIIGLNISSLARDVATYDLYDLAFRRIHAQEGGLVGFAHFSWNGCSLPRGFPWYVTTGELDFVELMQFNTINTPDYHDYLNLGFRLTAAAGSDVPWGSTIGEVRTYVHTGKGLDIDRWFAGLRKGHTFVSNGPALEFTVDGELPGSVLRRSAGDRLKVRGRAWGHPKVGLPSVLELIGGDGIVEKKTRADGQTELRIEAELEVKESIWLTLGTVCDNGAAAHTTPVYVTVGGRPTWSARRGPAIIQKQLEAISGIEKEFTGRTDQRSKDIIERLNKAREFYGKLARQMSGRP